MKKYLVKIGLFFLIIIVLDIVWGIVFQYMNDHSKGGGIKSRYYVCKEASEEVLIFGSSRAKHHYVPDIIEERLGMTCYNAGEDGNGIIYSYGALLMILSRYTPKYIIYDVFPAYDINSDDNIKHLDFLKPYYKEPGIDSIFWRVNPRTSLMMNSSLYRFNTSCVKIFGSYLHPIENYPKGYKPLFKEKTEEGSHGIEPVGQAETDTLKLYYFERFIQLAQNYGVKVICCVSPVYYGYSKDYNYEPIMGLLQKYNVPFFDFSQDLQISNEHSYFEDDVHLNDKGAHLFTNKVIDCLNQRYTNSITALQ